MKICTIKFWTQRNTEQAQSFSEKKQLRVSHCLLGATQCKEDKVVQRKWNERINLLNDNSILLSVSL